MDVKGRRVTVVEVGPRDGLQNERVTIGTADKIEFVNRLSAAKLAVIEVSPDGLMLREIASDTTVEMVKGATGADLIVSAELRTFD